MKPTLGVFGLSGCWGEQIVLLNCEDELLALVDTVEIVDFLGASSSNDRERPLDIALVEGSVAGPRQEDALRRIRARSTTLVACGTCACFGGVSAMRGVSSRALMAAAVYGPDAQRYDVSPHRPVSDIVKVDVAIPGCPMEKDEFIAAIAALLNGDVPERARYPVCGDCKLREQDCLLVSRGIACAGPVTAAGCGARCPGYGVPCIGCRGPVEEANVSSLQHILAERACVTEAMWRWLGTFAAAELPEPPDPLTKPVGQGLSPDHRMEPVDEGFSPDHRMEPVDQGFSPDHRMEPVGQGFSPDHRMEPVGQGFSPDHQPEPTS